MSSLEFEEYVACASVGAIALGAIALLIYGTAGAALTAAIAGAALGGFLRWATYP